MIGRLRGRLVRKSPPALIVDVGGVGYELLVPLSTYYTVGDPGAPVSLRVHTHVREDALQLFGFGTALEQALFQRLIGVSGIGPRVALAVLSGIEPPDLVRAIGQADVARLTRIPGVGRKTAERLVVELRDRLPETGEAGEGAPPRPGDALRDDLLSALSNLGYQAAAAEKAVDKVLARADSAEFEAVLRDVLRALAG